MTHAIVDTEIPRSEAVHHALDQVLLENLDAGEGEPMLRIWYRETPAVPLGRFQAYADEVATDYVDTHDISVIRRVTGGGAMYVEPGDVITFSMYLPRESVPENVEASYEELNQWVIDALNDLGLPVEHEPLNDITHPAGKIGGAAQLRKQNAVLHHTTMSFDLDIEAMLRTLRIGEEKLSDKAVESAEKRVALIADHIDANRRVVIDALVDSFRSTYGGTETTLPEDVLEQARKRAAETFETDNWNRRL